MSRENFYILLELPVSPPESDIDKINAAISKKQAEWSKLRNHPTKGRQAQLYLDMLPDIKTVMMDNDRRQQEAREAKQIAAKREKDKYKEVDSAIQLLSAKKQITEDELKKLSQRFSLPEDVIRKRIKVPIVKSKTKRAAAKRLEASVEKKISDSLNIIGKKSLYEFLELSPTSSINTLITKTRQKDQELKRDSRKDAILTASMELAGHCLNVFKAEDTRKMYDASLAYQRLDELNKAIDIAGFDGIIEGSEFDSLVKKAKEFGLSLEEGDDHIMDYCARKKWAVEKPAKFTAEEMRQCGNCGVMNTAESKNCAACGYPLVVPCPKCKHSNPSTNTNCSKCGFPIGDMPNALPLIKAAKEAKANGDVKKAAGLFRQALLLWPDHPEVMLILQEIESREKEVSQLAQELDDRVNDRKYYTARQVLFKLKQLDGAHPQLSVESMINGKINTAEFWVKKAGTASKGDDALDFFNQALLECKDCREALDGMAKFPPEPPKNLKVLPGSRSISLQWEKAGSRGSVSYRIARKPQSPPLHALDGENLGETSQTFFDDPGAVPGELYYFGIYSKRGEVFSKSGTIAGPVVRTAEIESLCITPGDSVVNLNWSAPANAKEIVVCMKSGGIPARRNDGQRLQGVRKDGVVATGLTNDQLYGFLVLAVFADENGADIYSAGVTCKSMPVAPPPPVRDMAVTKKENKLNVRWTPPGKGMVQIFYSRQSFPFSTGEVISTGKLSGIGTQIPVQNAGNVQMPVNFQGIIYLLPVTVEGDIAVAGKAEAATSIDEVSYLKGYINSGRLYLEWNWPAGAQKVLIMYSHHNFPTRPEDPGAVKKMFTRVEYLKHSGFILRSIEAKDYYFKIFVAAGESENTLYSAGRQCLVTNTGHVELYYDICLYKSFLGKVRSAELRLFSKDTDFKIPKTVLVKKLSNLPLRKTDGVKILEIEPVTVGTVPVSMEIPVRELHKGAYVKLFFIDDAHHQRYRIMPPSKDKLQLG
jgi:hypothetical protein